MRGRLLPQANDPFWQNHHILSNILLVNKWRDFGPWYIVLKVFLSAMLGLAINLGTQCQDNISTAFTSFLVVSPIVSQGLLNGLHILWAGVLGSAFGMISLAVWGLANSTGDAFANDSLPWLRVPLTMAVAAYSLFVLDQFTNPSAVTTAVFSALYVQLAAVPYPPMASDPIWAQVLVTRILALTTGVVAGTVVNVLLSGAFYDWIFKNQSYSTDAKLLDCLPKLLACDFSGEYIFSVLLSRITDAEAAIRELTWVSRMVTCDARLAKRSHVRLTNYVTILKLYLNLASLYGFVGKSFSSTDEVGNMVKEILAETTVRLNDILGWSSGVSTTGISLTDANFSLVHPVASDLPSKTGNTLVSDVKTKVLAKHGYTELDPSVHSIMVSLDNLVKQLLSVYFGMVENMNV
jgi:hypothetical protein